MTRWSSGPVFDHRATPNDETGALAFGLGVAGQDTLWQGVLENWRGFDPPDVESIFQSNG